MASRTGPTRVYRCAMLANGGRGPSTPRGFDAAVVGLRLGPIDAVFSVSTLLVLAGGGYARWALRGLTGHHPVRGGRLDRSRHRVSDTA